MLFIKTVGEPMTKGCGNGGAGGTGPDMAKSPTLAAGIFMTNTGGPFGIATIGDGKPGGTVQV